MKPIVDSDLCIGCEVCEEICPSVFQVIDGKSTVIDPEGCEYFECCEAAEENCPNEAITLEEEEE